jgi:cellulose synthase/poly-beta-1,6-N-acetylglucosamine synthase-like glycosyltransferase
VRRVARWFADRQVGVVCGRLVLTDPQTGQNVDSLYWCYETFLKLREARLGALLGANGAIYALRRDEFIPLPPLTILDDFVLPLTAKLRSGAEIVYEPKATAWEETPARISAEFGRRARIGAGGFQSLAMLRAIFALRHGWLLFAFVSHKLLRWICPLFLLTMLLATVVLIERELYRDLFVAQLAFYTLALVGAQIPGKSLAARIVRLQSMFCGMNLALAVGFWRFLSGRQRAAWQPAERRAVLNVGSKR